MEELGFNHHKNSREEEEGPYEKRERGLAAFRVHAVEGASEPTYPDIVLRIRELYLRNLTTIIGESNSVKRTAAVRDTAEMATEEFKNLYPEVRINEQVVISALKDYFGIEVNK